jgi:hypothetical protein
MPESVNKRLEIGYAIWLAGVRERGKLTFDGGLEEDLRSLLTTKL